MYLSRGAVQLQYMRRATNHQEQLQKMNKLQNLTQLTFVKEIKK